MVGTQKSIYELFLETFAVLIAETPEELQEVQRLRYQVYCLEHGFEDPEAFPQGLEADPYDARSAHALIRSARGGGAVGTVRLVLADPRDPYAPFPIEDHCGHAFHPWFRPRDLPRARVGEISRFAISRAYRKREGEGESADGLLREDLDRRGNERRVLPHLTVGLFRGIVRMSAQHRVSHWYAVMERRLVRSLRRFGIEFPAVGEPVEYHGVRVPCMGPALQVLDGVRRRDPEVWAFITEGTDLSLLASP